MACADSSLPSWLLRRPSEQSQQELDTAQLAAAGVVAGAKRLVLDVPVAGTDTGKLEGMAVTPHGRYLVDVHLVDDNDFSATPTQLDTYQLTRAQVYG